LDRFLSEPQESAAKVVDLLTRAKNRLHENKRAVR
jgi:glycylpeptide N-tetradecanoyltransferase